ncbi:MAG: M20/M25/M40 family metallo-hydrolase, partial [bacterium]|nr:M20/M25/M40 family metallo-hydrolase [bacterium]
MSVNMKVASDPVQLTADFVAVASVNPDLAGGPGENDLGEQVMEFLTRIGADVESDEVEGGRANVMGVLPGDIDRLVVLEAHLDTVPMPVVPLPVGVSNGKLWGRGACDTKASVAAMLVAMEQIAMQRGPRPTVMFAGVVDEEYVMRGAQVLASRISHADAVIIGEPTRLRVVRAHNGCVRFDIQVHGRTAHSSRATLGRNAILDAS